MTLKHLTEKQIATIINAADALNVADLPSEESITLLPDDIHKTFEHQRELGPLQNVLQMAIADLPLEARLELMAVLWLGRGDVPEATYDDFLQHARRSADEGDVGYIAEKSRGLPTYLRNGMAKLKAFQN